jgi:hypothetical protein
MNSAFGFVVLAGIATGIFFKKVQISIPEEDRETRKFQAWVGTFQENLTTLTIRMIRKKSTTVKKNQEWLSSSGEDASVITRNFYLGNADPSFTWKLSQEGLIYSARAEELIVDGWNSVVQLCIEFRLQESTSEEDIARLFKQILIENKIQWKKTLIEA